MPVHAPEKAPAVDALVAFGITGDLARKQTLRALYRLEANHHLTCRVIGVARQDWSTEHLIAHARKSIEESGERLDETVFGRLARRLSYLSGDFADSGTHRRLAQGLAGPAHPLFYLENPLLRVLPLVALVPPVGPSADDLRDKKAEVFRSMPDAGPSHYVRGQYQGYLDVPGVAKGSGTETYAALRLEVDNWRWAGVPFFIRTGKALATRVTEVRLVFRRPPRIRFVAGMNHGEPNQIVLRIDPKCGLRAGLTSQGAGRGWRTVYLDMLFEELGPQLEPYERLLRDAIPGDGHPFARAATVEETWRVSQPLLG